eukprot:6183665-Pleurochrysis_carterae.AAC.3
MHARLVRRNVSTAFTNLSGLTFGGNKGHASSHLFFVMDTSGQRGVYDCANTVTRRLLYCVPTALLLDQTVKTFPDLQKQMHAEKLDRLPHAAVEEQCQMTLLPSSSRPSIDKLMEAAQTQRPGTSPLITPVRAYQKLADQCGANAYAVATPHLADATEELMKLDTLHQSTLGFCASEGRHLELAVTLVKATLELNHAGLYLQPTTIDSFARLLTSGATKIIPASPKADEDTRLIDRIVLNWPVVATVGGIPPVKMKPNSAAKAVFQSTLKHWVTSRHTLAKWFRLLEHDYALRRPALQTRQHDKGETGDKALDAANTVQALLRRLIHAVEASYTEVHHFAKLLPRLQELLAVWRRAMLELRVVGVMMPSSAAVKAGEGRLMFVRPIN